MHIPVITTLAAGVLGLIFAILSALVVLQRGTGKVSIGNGDEVTSPLMIAIRSHANFAEYVPLILLLTGLIELRTGPTLLVKGLTASLVLARILHPVGMRIPGTNPFRAIGFLLTIIVLAVAASAAVLTTLG